MGAKTARPGEVKKKLSTILEKYHVLETITQEVFDNFYEKYNEEKEAIEKGLEACSGSMNISNLPVYLENAITLSRKLSAVWACGNIQFKEDLQKLIFPEGIYYDRKTQSFLNFIFELIASSSGTPPEKRKGTSYLIDYLSLSAGCRLQLSNRFVEDLNNIADFHNEHLIKIQI